MNVTAEEMVDALLQRIANLEMELAASQVLIRKLQSEKIEETEDKPKMEVVNG